MSILDKKLKLKYSSKLPNYFNKQIIYEKYNELLLINDKIFELLNSKKINYSNFFDICSKK